MSRRPRFLAIAALLILLGGGAGYYLWKRGASLPQRAIESYLRGLEPRLPFRFESIQVEAGRSDFLHGKITRLRLVIVRDGLRARMDGPLDFVRSHEKGELFSVEYRTLTELELRGARATPFSLKLHAQIASNLSDAADLGLHLDAPAFRWDVFGVNLDGLKLDADWEDSQARVELEFKRLAWKEKGREAEIVKTRLEVDSPLELKPFQAGPIGLELKSAGGELLFGDDYYDLALGKLPLTAKIVMDGALPKSADITLPRTSLKLRPTFRKPVGGANVGSLHALDVDWKISRWDLPEVFAALKASTRLAALGKADWRSGQLTGAGHARFRPDVGTGSRATSGARVTPGEEVKAEVEGQITLKDLALRARDLPAAARGIQAEASFSTGLGKASLRLSADDLYYKHFHGLLSDTRVILEKGPKATWVRFENGLPLRLEGIPLQIGAVTGTLSPEGGFEFISSIKIADAPLPALAGGLCYRKRTPPGAFTVDFPKIEFTSDYLDPTGSVVAKVFGGELRFDELGLFDLGTPVPELYFNARWDRIDLQQLGSWFSFGSMDGYLKGHALDVVFQSWLPTQFDFLAEVKPRNHSFVEFSPEAMKNTVRLFAGEEIDNLPGVANWLAFGWPSRVLGGYDVRYAGVSMFSREGSILVETLDPEENYRDYRVGAAREHFFLNGPRFKMPLKSERYPLVMDAHAMSNFARHMLTQFEEIARKKALEKEQRHEPDQKSPEQNQDSEMFESPCAPPAF